MAHAYEEMLNQGLYNLRLLECATHAHDQWSLSIGDQRCLASKAFDEEGVYFYAHLEVHEPGAHTVTLYRAGIAVGARAVVLEAGLNKIGWAMTLQPLALAS